MFRKLKRNLAGRESRAVRQLATPALLLALLLSSFSSFATPRDAPALEAFRSKLVAAAVERASHAVRYDPSYVAIPYPNGDVPSETGVCSDEIIRIYRVLGIDLQKEVHEDIASDPAAYGKRRADANIDHRRVENLIIFFRRHGESLPITDRAGDYQPGDIVTWDLHNGQGSVQGHIGMVVDRQTFWTKRYKILHNIGDGPQIEDVLFDWKITGHFRYSGTTK